MKKSIRILSLILAVAMLLTCVSIPAFADETLVTTAAPEEAEEAENIGTAKYFEYDFEADKLASIAGIVPAAKNNVITLAGRTNEKYLAMRGMNNGSDFFIDIAIKGASRYMILQADFMVEKTGASIQLVSVKDAGGARANLLSVDAKGNLLDAAGNKIGKVEEGKWFKAAVCADFDAHVCDVYIDDVKIAQEIAFNSKSGYMAEYRAFVAPGSAKLNIDNLTLFNGKTPADYATAVDAPSASTPSTPSINIDTSFPQDSYISPSSGIDLYRKDDPKFSQYIDTDSSTRSYIAEVKDAVCLKVDSPFALVRHEQKRIDENNPEVAPFVIEGRTLVPVRFIAEAFNAKVDWDAKTRTVTVKSGKDTLTLVIGSSVMKKNGKDVIIDVPAAIYNDRTMLPLRAVTENLGKEVFWDDMGLIVISDKPVDISREKNLNKVRSVVESFIYERPSREQLLADIASTTPNHPRLMATAEDFERIKGYLAYDENVQRWYADLIKQADKFVAEAPTEGPHTYTMDSGGRLQSEWKMYEKAPLLGMAWQLTGDMKYVDAMWYTLKDICNREMWPHWHPGHFLNAADLMWSVSIAYDWMYDAWTPEQRYIIEEALFDCGIEDGITTYYGATDYLAPPMGVWQRNQWWSQGSNWNPVGNNGVLSVGIVLATHEKYSTLAIKCIDFALRAVESGLRQYAPDGDYEEGPSYWAYGTNHAILFIEGISTAAGNDYGLADAPGFKTTYATPLYTESRKGMFNYSDTSVAAAQTEMLMWFGKQYNNLYITGVRAAEINSGAKKIFYTDLLWYNPDYDRNATLQLDYSFYKTNTFTMRSSWTDDNQFFVGIHAGNNDANHAHLDSGSFVVEVLGERWFTDLGPDNYNLPKYFAGGTGGGKWQYYALRAEGHNCYVINPGKEEDQVVKSVSPVVEFVSKPRGAYGIVDLAPAYEKQVNSARRGMLFTANRKAVVIQDEIVMKKPSTFYWFAHTAADIEVAEDGRSAILTQSGKKLHVALVSNDKNLKFTTMGAERLPTSPIGITTDAQKENRWVGIKKLVIEGQKVSKLNFAVVCQPLTGEEPEYTYTYTAMDKWSVPDGNIIYPEATDIKIDGETIAGFSKDVKGYSMLLPYGTTQAPYVTATADENSVVQVTNPKSLPGAATVKVMDKNDPSMYTVYTVSFRAAAELEIIASGAQDGNPPSNCMDGDLGTRWAVEGEESYAIYQFAEAKPISSIWIAVWKSDQRKQKLSIELSEDGVNFTEVFNGQSSIEKDELEEYKVPAGKYKAVRLNLKGTTAGNWNSVLEVEFRP